MQVLQKFEFTQFGAKRSHHNWDMLLDGQIYQLEQGKDFNSKPATLISLARNQAKLRGLTIRATKVEGGVVLQAVKPEAETTEPATKKRSRK